MLLEYKVLVSWAINSNLLSCYIGFRIAFIYFLFLIVNYVKLRIDILLTSNLDALSQQIV